MIRYQHIYRMAGQGYRSFSAASNMKGQFQSAAERVKKLSNNPGQDTALKLYALFKQGSVGENKTKKPSAIDFVGSAKWKAWSSLGTMSQEEAQKKYVELVDQLAGEDKSAQAAAQSGSASTGAYKTLSVEQTGKLFKIAFNRPDKKNAISLDMYNEIEAALAEAGKADTLFTVFTGKGDYYCSGNDLSNFAITDVKEIPKRCHDASLVLKRYIAAYIDHPKPLVALVNGPAIGIAVTVLGMFDLVYASDKATFETPFGRLGQAPEGCSTFTFPRMMGFGRATEVLFLNRKLTAEAAQRYGLVTEVFPQASFAAETSARLETISQLPKDNIVQARKLIRDLVNKELHAANEAECKLSEQRWQSKEALDAIMKFFSRSKM